MDSLPDSLILQILKHVHYKDICSLAQTSHRMSRICKDDIMWKYFFQHYFNVDSSIPIPEGTTWLSEFQRLIDQTPQLEVQELKQHSDQVLHVSFSHDGSRFATCAKDGYIMVWKTGHPVTRENSKNLKFFSWKYTQYSEFNESDRLLLVSGVLFGQHSTAGEIAIFNLDPFELQCRVVSKPYDIFGAWYSDSFFLSGQHQWLNNSVLVSRSVIWINKASQESESSNKSVMNELYKFYNRKASSVRCLMIANCSSSSSSSSPSPPLLDEEEFCVSTEDSISSTCSSSSGTAEILSPKWLICTSSTQTYTPHVIGFKKINPIHFNSDMDPGPSVKDRLEEYRRRRRTEENNIMEGEGINWGDYESVANQFDVFDHCIDLHGHIIGMGLSPDHRTLFVNCRPWPQGYRISDPLQPPPIASEIDIHVIDLTGDRPTLLHILSRAHRAFTPNEECFFIFLNVNKEYVGSGAEDKHAYIWDRHFEISLLKLPHCDVVNSVAFNPSDSEMLVSVSDDYSVKVWRSRRKCREFGITPRNLKRGVKLYRSKSSKIPM